MIVELLTPLVIATAPVRIDLPEVSYNHEQQVSIITARAETTEYGNPYGTFGGTRTFDFQGNPYDNDND